MLKPLPSLALGALLSLLAAQAMALGFGRVSNATALGQPLSFTVGVRLEGDDNLSADCVAVEVFSGESRVPSSALRISIEAGSDPGERNVRVTSNTVIDEPVLNVNLQLACPNRLARKFVAFIDPPGVNLALATPPPPAIAVAARGEPPAASSPAAAAATSPAATKAPAKAAPRQARRAPAPAVAAKAPDRAMAAAGTAPAQPKRTKAAPAKLARAPAKAPAARLELEASHDEPTRDRLALRLTSTMAAASASAAASSPAPVPDAEAAQRAKERERLVALEDSLTKLRAESQATQASLAHLQLRLHEAEAQRYANPLVYALAALAAALAAVLGMLLWQRHAGQRADAQWWTAPPEQAEPHKPEPADDWSAAGPQAEPVPRRSPMDETALAETTASPMLLTQVHAAMAEAAFDTAPRPGAEPEQREMSVEELIDLEQQAEFFVVLGQDEAAIDLLMGHLRSSGGASPLPYLKLLEIYRRRGEREAYERMRERFNRRFNAYAPDWAADPQQGRALLDYPNVVAGVQALWATPVQAMQALEAALFRRDTRSSTFDLPAYRELLFLYSVARDLSERESPAASVDLLLPIGGEAADPRALTPLHPTPAALSIEPPAGVDVDISRFDAGPSGNDDSPSRFHTDFSPTSGYMGLPGESALKPR